MLVAFGLFAWMSLKVGALDRFSDQVVIELHANDAAGISSGSSVSVAGVRVGIVEDMRVETDHAVLTLAIDPGYGLLSDTRARIRARSVLGEKYIELVPGTAGEPLESHDRIELLTEQTEIDEMVTAMAPVMGAIDPDAIAKLSTTIVQAVGDDPERVGRILQNLDRTIANAAEASDGLPELVDSLHTTSQRAQATLSGIDARTRELQPVIVEARALIQELSAVAAEAPDLADDVERVVDTLLKLMDELDGSGEEVRAILDNLSEIDKWELRRLLREEGILVRLKPHDVVPDDATGE